MRVAVYARHSTSMQEASTQDQIERCRKWCEQRKYRITSVFTDEAVSGAHIANRPGIQNMIDAAINDQFDRVVAEDLSRLSRNQGDIANFYQKMAFIDVAIETISDGLVSELQIGFKGTMNALYLKDLGDKTKRGMIASVLKGSVPGGSIYGYDLVGDRASGVHIPGKRQINEEQAAVIQQIFDLYLDGKSLKAICDELNQRNVPSPSGGIWHGSSLIGTASRQTGLLRQTLYKGLITFNRMEFRKDPETGKRKSIPRPPDEWINVPIPELTIIPADKFDAVQRSIDKRSSMRRLRQLEKRTAEQKAKEWREAKRRQRPDTQRKHAMSLTAKRVYCSECKTRMKTVRAGQYSCANDYCQNRSLRRERIEPEIFKVLEAFSPEDLLPFNDLTREKYEELQSRKAKLEKQLADARKKAENLIDQMTQRYVGEMLRNRLETLELEVKRTSLKIREIDKEIAVSKPLSEKEAAALSHKFKNLVTQFHYTPDDLTIYQTLLPMITSVHVWRDTELDDYQLEYINYDLEMIVRTIRI